MRFSSEILKKQATELGFNICGVIQAKPAPTLDGYFRWIEHEMHGKMGYMARPDRQIRRKDPNVIVPGVKSMVLIGLDYREQMISETTLQDPARGRIASYAWGLDYHDIITPRLEKLADWLQGVAQDELAQRVYVDTGAILERAHAQQAGMGFIGKNTMLINSQRGSYFFLGEILTTLEFDHYDQMRHWTLCGTCIRCMNACPTDAFPQPFVLDARRCISYHTIENKGFIDRALRAQFGNWVFGCDICQDVCPWQRFTKPTREPMFQPKDTDRAAPQLLDLLTMDETTFETQFANSPIQRIKRERLVRNACIAAGNWGDAAAIPPLQHLLHDESPLVRGHAVWALEQIMGAAARPHLQSLRNRETDADVINEIEAATHAMAQ